MYKLLTSNRGSDEFSIGFHRDRVRRQQEITNNKNVKGKNHVRITLKEALLKIFDCVEKRKKLLTDCAINQPKQEKKDGAVSDKTAGIADVRIKNDLFHWYVPHYTPSI